MIHFPKFQPAPPSLAVEKEKANGTYRQEDVILQLQIDFKNKCYLCEEKEPTSINIEHFIAHKGNIDLKFDWNNLFFACVHCNSTKQELISISDNILNCTRLEDQVDRQIHHYLKTFPKETVIITAKEKEVKVQNTVALLDAIYNGTTPSKKMESNNLRKKILKEIKQFQTLLENYLNAETDKEVFQSQINKELSMESAFTAFKRWIIWDNETLKKVFSIGL